MSSPGDPISRYAQDSYSVDEKPHRTTPARKLGFFRAWFSRSEDIRPTSDTTEVKWGIHWLTPVTIISLFLFGTASAAGHHFFYSFMNQTEAGDKSHQEWTLRIGSGLSFLAKFMLTIAIGLSRTQYVWLTLRSNWLTVGGIDAVFGVISDPLFFFNKNMWRHAKTATVIAIAMWMIPIATILTPATLTVDTFERMNTVPCRVKSLVFPFDPKPPARVIAGSDIAKGLEVVVLGSWENSTSGNMASSTSTDVTRLFLLSAYNDAILNPIMPSPLNSSSITTLGQKCGSNCTYTIQFLGPAVRCTEFTSWPWMDMSWKNSTAFLDRFGYRTTDTLATNDGFLAGCKRKIEILPTVVQCRVSTARYTVQLVVQEHRFLEPVLTNVETIPLTISPQSLVYPDIRYLSHRALISSVFNLMKGTIVRDGTQTVETSMIDTQVRKIFERGSNQLGPLIESMSDKMVVSILGYGGVSIKGAAAVLDVDAIQDTNCITTERKLYYVYSARTLLVVYAVAIACALVAAVAGLFALGQNGMASEQTVSAIIRTTRNPTLDEHIVGGGCLGGHAMSKELENLELQFGALRADRGTAGGRRSSPFALGVRGEISPIKRD